MIPAIKKLRGREVDAVAVQDNVNEWIQELRSILEEITDEEYAFNDDTTSSSNYTSFANGEDGAKFPAIVLTTGTIDKRVRFLTPIGDKDRLQLEIEFGDAPGKWFPNDLFPLLRFGTYSFGVGLSRVPESDFDVEVAWGNGGSSPTGGTGATGAAWDTTNRWRVRRSRY